MFFRQRQHNTDANTLQMCIVSYMSYRIHIIPFEGARNTPQVTHKQHAIHQYT